MRTVKDWAEVRRTGVVEPRRREELLAREGVEGMSDEEMRMNLITCDFRGCEVKALVLERLLSNERLGAAKDEEIRGRQ